MRQRREVAARADRAPARDVRQNAAVEELDEQLDGLHARAGETLGEGVRAQQHRRADDLVRIGLADPAGMASKEAHLQLLGQLLRDRARDEPAEAGVDAVRVLLLAVNRALDEVAGGLHALPGGVREPDGRVIDCHRPHVGESEVVAGESLALDHAASVSRVRGRPGRRPTVP